MLFRETVAVYCENHTQHTNTLCGQNAEFWCVKEGGTYSNHWVLKSLNVIALRKHRLSISFISKLAHQCHICIHSIYITRY
jgi:hypothetical protein